ncbi:uncharacterized protein LOC143246529 [Tachypleus tridentatus]|uniref:uncharacterized protein LOC143246529 n=1 Tax=Tachypleus tridentatus TaxID=6853 RepID=UPI003FD3181B
MFLLNSKVWCRSCYKLLLVAEMVSRFMGQPIQMVANKVFSQDLQHVSRPTPFPIRDVDPSEVNVVQMETLVNNRTLVTNTSFSHLMNITYTKQMRKRERMRQNWIERLKSLILRGVGISQEPNVTTTYPKKILNHFEKVVDKIDKINSKEESMRFEKLQSFYPSCSIPEDIDRNLWNDARSFNIYYNLSFMKTTSQAKIKLAKLRLFKNKDLMFNDLNKNPGLLHLPLPHLKIPRLSERNTGLTVSLYQYKRPLNNASNEADKTYLYSRIIAGNYQGWIEFDVTSSFQYWSKMPQRNHGFSIEIEDSYEGNHNPNLFLVNFNCDEEDANATATIESPFPNIEEIYLDMEENDTAFFGNDTFPTLDFRTIEMSPELVQTEEPQPTIRTLSKRQAEDDTHINSVVYENCEANTEEYRLTSNIVKGKTILFPKEITGLTCLNTCSKKVFGKVRPDELCRQRNKNWTCKPMKMKSWQFVYMDENRNILLGSVNDLVIQTCFCVCSLRTLFYNI